MTKVNFDRKSRRKRRVSCNITGTNDRPRVSVFRSNKYIYAQAVDDVKRVTLAACSSVGKTGKPAEKINKSAQAKTVGINLAKILLKKDIKAVVFDRGVYTYLGRVQSLADGLREGGIKV